MATTVAALERVETSLASFDGKQHQEMIGVLSRSWASFRRIAFRYLGNAADAEDAVQDALVSAFEHLDQFRGQAKMSTWLSAIVVNAARMQLRRRLRYTHVAIDDENREHGSEPFIDQLSDYGPSPEELCRKSELARKVARSARKLSPPLRKVFQLRELDGLSIRETAALLGVAEGTVKARLARARGKLRQQMRAKLDRKRPVRVMETGSIDQ